MCIGAPSQALQIMFHGALVGAGLYHKLVS
jgi:hypothetical protein